MCNGPILKNLLIFALPLILSSILQLLFNAADIIVVGRFAGDDSLAAVGATTSIINLLTNLFIGLSIGSNILVARYLGAKENDNLQETIHTSIMLSILCGFFLTLIGIALAPKILTWMQTPTEILPSASVYLRIYFAGTTATMVYNFGSAILRAIGDTKRPLYYLIISGVLNVTLNLLFVIVFQWNVFGVGLATAISQSVSALLVIRCLLHERSSLRLEVKKLRVHKDKMIQIIQIGLPAGLQGTLFSISNVVVQSSLNLFAATMVAGDSIAGNIEGFVYVGMNAFYHAAISFISQNMGAKKYGRIDKILISALLSAFLVGFTCGNLAVLFGRNFLDYIQKVRK